MKARQGKDQNLFIDEPVSKGNQLLLYRNQDSKTKLELSSVPERLREFLLIRRLINNLKAAEAGHEIPAAVEDPSRIRLEHELQMLAKAHEADMDFEDLHVSTRAVRSFCAGNSSRQCRSFCFNLGDRACSDGDIGGNGEDSHFIESGMNPGK
ncbi:uncharacterized protein LOC134785249 [Penaeus indicus]|uniref:uncharacterized protein LOC134785249 n=1 Tax=Penaeus indicus TaxID=29960 RepID=UPI00300D3C75